MKHPIRYAVVGLGHIAQVAVLPAFEHARKNSVLSALISGDPAKLKKLGRRYGVDQLYTYENYEDCLRSGEIDAVYIATPNSTHPQFVEPAIAHGIHVLCEKPFAVDQRAAYSMIEYAQDEDVKLMVAYRLHFERTNLEAIEIAETELGDLKLFNSVFTTQVQDKTNIRLQREMGGGPLLDIGIYCINAARYLFRDEPIQVTAFSASSEDPKFSEVDESLSAILRFPGERLATFTVSFGAKDYSAYDVLGTEGSLRVENAYEYSEPTSLFVTIGDKTREKKFEKRDQFAPELIYFSECIQKNKEPEPSGEEGLADLRIMDAITESAEISAPVTLSRFKKESRPSLSQEIKRPPVKHQTPFHAHSPH